MYNNSILESLSKLDVNNFLEIPNNVQTHKSLNNFQSFKFSVAIPEPKYKEVSRYYGAIDYEKELFRLIKVNISNHITNSLTKSLLETKDTSYANSDEDKDYLLGLLLYPKIKHDYKGFITNRLLTNKIIMMDIYNSINSNHASNTLTFYKYGDFRGMEFWINELQRYDDSYILFFDDIYLNYRRFYLDLKKEDTLEIGIDIAIHKNKSSILYLMGDETSDDIKNSYKRYKRNGVLEDILK